MKLSELYENPDNPSMATSAVRGVFREDPRARAEFLKLIGR